MPYLSGLGEDDVAGRYFISPVIYGEDAFPFCNESDVVIGQGMRGASGEELFYILQFYDIYQKFAAVFGFVEGIFSVSGFSLCRCSAGDNDNTGAKIMVFGS